MSIDQKQERKNTRAHERSSRAKCPCHSLLLCSSHAACVVRVPMCIDRWKLFVSRFSFDDTFRLRHRFVPLHFFSLTNSGHLFVPSFFRVLVSSNLAASIVCGRLRPACLSPLCVNSFDKNRHHCIHKSKLKDYLHFNSVAIWAHVASVSSTTNVECHRRMASLVLFSLPFDIKWLAVDGWDGRYA